MNTNNNNITNNNSHYKQGEKKSKDIEIKQAKIFKQIIMTPQHYPPTFLPCLSVLNPPEKHYINERYGTTLDIEIEKKK